MEGAGGPLVHAEGLTKRFGATVALDGLTLGVAGGEILALLGPSGSGKSTLLLCLAGILRPDSGTVRYRGQALSDMADAVLTCLRREEFGFVFQFGQLVPDLTAVENVSLPLQLSGQKRGLAEERALALLTKLEVEDRAGKRVGEMSGGQAQRVAVARALIAEPKVIFADEPTGSLDSLNGEVVMGLLLAAARERGTTVVLVTHEPRIAAYADREVVVRDGRISQHAVVP
ncbi:MAG: ABC transporter ATP-binding protein [Actinobacteria bacterium]|nr:ABC transporter ATP-binding protein [Actinomycetota bacterium]